MKKAYELDGVVPGDSIELALQPGAVVGLLAEICRTCPEVEFYGGAHIVVRALGVALVRANAVANGLAKGELVGIKVLPPLGEDDDDDVKAA